LNGTPTSIRRRGNETTITFAPGTGGAPDMPTIDEISEAVKWLLELIERLFGSG
jgi:hypothetical protein